MNDSSKSEGADMTTGKTSLPATEAARAEGDRRGERPLVSAVEADRLRSVLERAPAMITFLEGPDLVVTFSNASHRRGIGGRDIEGKPLAQAMPELTEEVLAALKDVQATGKPFHHSELRVRLLGEDDTERDAFFDVVWEPLKDEAGAPIGVVTFSHDVTAHVRERERAKQLAEALRDSEELFRVAQDVSPHAFVFLRCIRDENGALADFHVIAQNDAASRFTGMPSGTAPPGLSAFAAYPDFRVSELSQHYARVVETGAPYVGELAYQGGGLDVWFRVAAARMLDGLAVVFEDITARKRAEQQRDVLLVDAERARGQVAAVFAQAPVGIAVWGGPDHVFELANDIYLRMAGRRDVVGKRIRDVFPEEELANGVFLEVYDRVYATGEGFTTPEFPVFHDRRGDGSRERLVYSFTIAPRRDHAGAIDGLILVITEVTELVRAREGLEALSAALAASEDRFRIVQEASPDGFMIFGAVRDGDARIVDFTFLYVNPAAEQLVGRPAAELVGKRLLVEMPGNREEGLFDVYVEVVTSGRPHRHELAYHHEGISTAFRLLVLRLGDGFAVTFEDVTERMRSQAERASLLARVEAARVEAERQRALAEDASRLKDEFLATVSHELRTPLQAMLGWARLLGDGRGVTEDKVRRGIAAIERNARAQAKLIDDILDASRIVTGKLSLACEPLALAPLVEEAVDSLRIAADTKGIALVVSVVVDDAHVMADPERLQQIVWNLVSNAIKFTPAGGRIDVSLERHRDRVRLAVQDTGKGIAKDFLPHVFERFRQADGSSTRTEGGLGLGLAIVRHLVELHGGEVTAESDGEGKGATFAVWFRERAAVAALSSRGGTEDAEGALAGLKVLLVEDEEDARELAGIVLTRAGANVVAVASSSEARAEIERSAFDALVSDIGMPNEDGHSLMQALRAQGNTVPAVALTAYAGSEDRRRASQAGFDAHIAKPADADALVRVLLEVLRTKGQSRA